MVEVLVVVKKEDINKEVKEKDMGAEAKELVLE